MPAFLTTVAFALTLALTGSALAKGAPGVAPDGTPGHLHVVAKGDTLWDITSTYLGTPWVWPSLWKENQKIRNPHRIFPGDMIWITAKGMRKVTPEEAAELLARGNVPAAPGGGDLPGGASDPFATLDGDKLDVESSLYFPGLHRFSFVSPEQLTGAAAVLGSHDESYWESQERRTIVSIGEGQVHVGDPFTALRVRRRVYHPGTNELVGYFVEVLGKIEVTEVHPEASYVKVVTSYAEIEPGDRVIPFTPVPDRFTATRAPSPVEGVIVAQQPHRQWSGRGDLVILDRGKHDGVDVGVQLDIVRRGREVLDPVTTVRVLVPDDVVGRVMVLKAEDQSALALVTKARTEVRAGDYFRSF